MKWSWIFVPFLTLRLNVKNGRFSVILTGTGSVFILGHFLVNRTIQPSFAWYSILLHCFALFCIVWFGVLCYLVVSNSIACYCIVGFSARAVSRKTPIYFITSKSTKQDSFFECTADLMFQVPSARPTAFTYQT
jgi:hypothetical protein